MHGRIPPSVRRVLEPLPTPDLREIVLAIPTDKVILKRSRKALWLLATLDSGRFKAAAIARDNTVIRLHRFSFCLPLSGGSRGMSDDSTSHHPDQPHAPACDNACPSGGVLISWESQEMRMQPPVHACSSPVTPVALC